MKKICVIPAGYKPIPPVNGGAVETIIQNMIELNEKYTKLNMTVLSVENKTAIKQSTIYKNTKYVYFKNNPKADKVYYWIIYKTFKKFLNIILPDYLVKKQMIKYAYEKKDEYDWFLFEGGEIDCLKYYSKILDPEKILYHSHGTISNKKHLETSFQYYIAVSNYVKNVWTKSIQETKRNMAITLPNGINQEKFKVSLSPNQRESKRKEYRFDNNDTILVFVGRIIPEKGVVELLNCMKLLPDNFKLLIIGSSNFGEKTMTKYEKKVSKLVNDLENRVVFSGYVPNDKIGEYYQIGDISVVPSMFDDPAPLVIIEAMAAGLPIVTTGSGGIKEYCNENCAVFVERGEMFVDRLKDAVLDLSANKNTIKKMSVYGKERASMFTDIAQYQNFVDLLETIS